MPIDNEPLETPLLIENNVINFLATANTTWAKWFGQIRAALQDPVPVTFAGLPQRVAAGTMAIITDSTVNTWGAVISGGGTFTVLALFNGTNWTVLGQ